MNKSSEEIFARLMELQRLLGSPSVALDKERFQALDREYRRLTDAFGSSMFGGKKKDSEEVVANALDQADFKELAVDPIGCEEFSITDSLYAGEGFFPKRSRLTISGVRFSQPRKDRIQFVELETSHAWTKGKLKYLGHFSADTGCVLALNRRRKVEIEKQELEQWLTSTHSGELIRPIETYGFKGLMIESQYGSGGFCVYGRNKSLILDFSSVRSNPELVYGKDD